LELRRADWVLAVDLNAAREARAHVAQALIGVSPASLDVALLLTSELVTNAVRHGAGPVRLRLAWDDRGVRVEVADSSLERPILRPIDREAPNGRGLLLVDAMSSGWGVETADDGKTVWFDLAW
jgi:anti-sigma regulatory factor (Ser/Thr protein kinase)